MKSVLALCCILLLMGTSYPCRAGFKVTKVCDSVVDAKALTLKDSVGGFKATKDLYGGPNINAVHCAQDVVVTHGKYQYVGYYDAKARLALARRKLPAGDWESIRFADYIFKSNDDHNTICIGVCPNDGTIHMAFDHHGNPLHYRVSQKGAATDPESVRWDASLFGPVISELEKGKRLRSITYPRFWQTPEGNLQFCYRIGWSGGGDRILVDYDGHKGTWSNTRQIDSRRGHFLDTFSPSPSRCSYPNGYNYGPKGRLHVTWTWRERSQGPNHDIMYAYSEDRGKTWLNNQGEKLKDPPHIGSAGIQVVDISRKYSLMNTQAQAVDSQGRIHVVMWHTTDATLKAANMKRETGSGDVQRWGPPDARRYHHYWRAKNGVWQHRELPWVSGTIAKLFIDANDNAFLVYGAKKSPDIPVEIHDLDHNCTIAAATGKSKWKDWQIIHAENESFLSDMLGDLYRWQNEGVLSIIVQETPKVPGESTPLRILDFSFEYE